MAIKPVCDSCKKEIESFGSILLSPPFKNNIVKKFHICIYCYEELVGSWAYPNEKTKIGVGIIVKKGNKILIGKRKDVPLGKDTWGFPGGHLEYNESFEDAAKREVFEETGIKVKNIKFASATNDVWKKERKHYVTIYMTCNYASGKAENKENEKCEGWKWILWKDLPAPLFFPIRNLLKQNFNPF